MNERRKKTTLLTLILLLSACGQQQPINYAAIFDRHLSAADIALIAPSYSFVWGAHEENVTLWHNANPSIIVSRYIPFTRDVNATQDLTYWQSFHPDWILYQCDRITPAYEFDDANMPLDISNPQVHQWQLTNAIKAAQDVGYDAIAFDNFSLRNEHSSCGIWQNGQWIQKYTGQPDDEAFAQDVLTWLKAMRAGTTLKLTVNWSNPYNDTDLDNTIWKLIDGVIDERGFYHEHYDLEPQELSRRAAILRKYQPEGKFIVSINQIDPNEFNQQTLSYIQNAYNQANAGMLYLFISNGIQGYGSSSIISP